MCVRLHSFIVAQNIRMLKKVCYTGVMKKILLRLRGALVLTALVGVAMTMLSEQAPMATALSARRVGNNQVVVEAVSLETFMGGGITKRSMM